MHNLRSSIPLAIAAAFAVPHSAPAAAEDVASLRAQGPSALRALLGRYDLLPAGPERDQLAQTIDAVAAQRYATVSRLYWYTDLDAAQDAARAEHRPILALRMLGRLDDELSCANSRLFRTTLYANARVSKFLRDHFVLLWTTERPVPRVTIDFGDGRKLERTTTGNSTHYVLDERGRVIDVLPGLYAPPVFQAELEKSLALAGELRGLPAAARATALRAHHEREARRAAATFDKVAGTQFLRGRDRLLPATERDPPAIQRAPRATMSKMAMEVPDLGKIGILAGDIPRDDVATWAAVGQQAWGIVNDPAADPGPRPLRVQQAAAPRIAPRLLDERSLALIQRLHDAGPIKATPGELAAMVARLERNIVADTALNELSLRQAIRARIAAEPNQTWVALNEWVYATVFHTPRSDAWLGLLPRTDFTGLPGDGVVMP